MHVQRYHASSYPPLPWGRAGDGGRIGKEGHGPEAVPLAHLTHHLTPDPSPCLLAAAPGLSIREFLRVPVPEMPFAGETTATSAYSGSPPLEVVEWDVEQDVASWSAGLPDTPLLGTGIVQQFSNEEILSEAGVCSM